MTASHSSATHTIASIEEQLRRYLVDELGADKAIESSAPLFSAGVLDSFDIVQVLDYVNREFAVEISPLQVNLDNFDSIERIGALIMNGN